jgi:hypothetical protein
VKRIVRVLQHQPPEEAIAALMRVECPDCDADFILRDDLDSPRVWRLDIAHDETCPAYHGITGVSDEDHRRPEL